MTTWRNEPASRPLNDIHPFIRVTVWGSTVLVPDHQSFTPIQQTLSCVLPGNGEECPDNVPLVSQN